jgi:hypothetical protein
MTKRIFGHCFWQFGLVLLGLASVNTAWACAICAPAAETTLISRLAVARQVMLARPLAAAGHFAPVVAIKGALPEPGAPALQSVVDDRPVRRGPAPLAETAKALPAKPATENLAVLSFSALTQRWMHLADVPRDRTAWLHQIAVMPPAAQVSAAAWPARLLLFAPDLQHPAALVAQTAFEEIASAPYAVMRLAFRMPGPGIKPSPSQLAAPRSTQLLGWLQDDELAARHSLYYLLLGLAADPRSVDFLTQNLARVAAVGANRATKANQPVQGVNALAAGFSAADVSAQLAALMEIRGAGVLPWVEQHFLTHTQSVSAAQSPEAQRQSMALAQAAVLALGVHGALGANGGALGGTSGGTSGGSAGSGPAALSTGQVVQVYANYIRRHPEMAGLVASDLANWEQWQFASAFAHTLQNQAQIPFASRYAMVFYLLRNPRTEAKALVEKLRLAKVI